MLVVFTLRFLGTAAPCPGPQAIHASEGVAPEMNPGCVPAEESLMRSIQVVPLVSCSCGWKLVNESEKGFLLAPFRTQP